MFVFLTCGNVHLASVEFRCHGVMDSNEQPCRKWERPEQNVILTILPFFQATKNDEITLSNYISLTISKTL